MNKNVAHVVNDIEWSCVCHIQLGFVGVYMVALVTWHTFGKATQGTDHFLVHSMNSLSNLLQSWQP